MRTPESCDPSEADRLLADVAVGDRKAFAELYDLLSAPVFGVCLRVLHDRAQAEEVLQEVFVELWREAPRYRENRGSARAWVLRLARMRAIDRLRSWLATLDRDDREAMLVDVVGQPSVEETALERVEGARVRDALAELGEPHRTAVRLVFFAGLSHRELAEVTGVPLGTAKTRVRDGLRKMRGTITWHDTINDRDEDSGRGGAR